MPACLCVEVFKHAWGLCMCMSPSLCVRVCVSLSLGALCGVVTVCENEPVFVHVQLHTY